MSDAATVLVAFACIGSAAYSIKAIADAVVRYNENKLQQNPLPSSTDARLQRMEQAVDAIAIEIERISEGQRFTTKLLSERVEPHRSRTGLPQ